MEVAAGRTVLVVEDDRTIADVVRIYLERDGFRAVLEYDGHEALQLADGEQPALTVLDSLTAMTGAVARRAGGDLT